MIGFNGYRITPATIHDVQAIHRIDQKAFRPWKDQWPVRYLFGQLARPDLTITVAREGFGEEQVVGYLMVDRLTVVKIGVDVPRRGIGKSLVHAFLLGLPPGATSGTAIRHRNEASIGLFTSMGFVLTSGVYSKRHARTWGWYVHTVPKA